MSPFRSLRTPGALAILSLAACTDGTAPQRQLVSISLTTPAAASVAAPAAAAALVPITGGGHTLDLGTVAITVGDVRLEQAGHQGADDHGVGTDDVLFDAGPLTIALPAAGGVVTLASRSLPAGTFSEVEAELETMHLAGSYDGAAFDVVVELSHDLEIALTPPLTTTGGAEDNVTIAIDPSACFAPGGVPVDPRTLTDGGSDARRAFRDCVAGRLRAFEDRNRDGHGENESGDDR